MKTKTTLHRSLIAALLCLLAFTGTTKINAQWSELGGTASLAANSIIYSTCSDAAGNVYAAGDFTNGNGKYYVAKYDGTSWTELGGANSLAANGVIYSICSDASGNIYAAGDFKNARLKRYVAKYDGTSWSELGGTNALAANGVIRSICSDAVGNIYAAGNFKNSSINRYVAKYNGSTWSEFGGLNALAANKAIYSICSDASGNIYAAGNFRNGIDNRYVAKYDGTGWNELGGSNALPANGIILSICSDAAGNLYAAGNFRNGSSYYVAKYNGSTWSKLGGTNALAVNNPILTTCSDAAGNIYAAGEFVNGSSNRYVAKYNGSSWSELGGTNALAANGIINSIGSDISGNIYASGAFSNGSNFYVAKFSSCIPTTSTTNTSICPSALPYSWNGLTFTEAGTQTKTGFVNAGGCDSSATLNLTVDTNVGINSVSAANNPICAGTTTDVTANGVVGTNAVVNWYDSLSNSLGAGITLTNVGPGIRYIAQVTGTCGSPVEASLKVIGDTVNPTISCPSNINVNSISATCSKPVATTAPAYSDNCSVNLLSWTFSGATTASSPAGGIRLVDTKVFNVGTTTVTYTVTDNTGRTNTCSFDVNVVDISKPDFTATNSNMVESVVSGCDKSIAISDVSFTDACGTPSLSWVMTGATTGSGSGQMGTITFNVGVSKIVYTLTDPSGNTNTSSFTVQLKETVLPTISCPANITLTTVGTNCTRYANVVAPTYGDNCGVTSLTWSMTGATVLSSPGTGINVIGGKLFNAGLTTVTYIVKDASSNSNSCSLTVQINTTNSCGGKQIAAKVVVENQEILSGWKVKLSPNPTTAAFVLQVQSNNKAAIDVSVYNNEGKKIQQLKSTNLNNIMLGEKYVRGSYLIEVRQGDNRTTVEGVKQ